MEIDLEEQKRGSEHCSPRVLQVELQTNIRITDVQKQKKKEIITLKALKK